MLTKSFTKRTTAAPLSSNTPPKIGLPRALLYHKYAPMWTTFFRLLGCPTITSPNTNRQILEQGLQYAIDENCLAVKIFLGHVHYLLDKVDYVLIPHIVTLHPAEAVCVKLLALGDIVQNTFRDAHVLKYEVDVAKGEDEITGMTRLGLQLNRDLPTVRQAVDQARTALTEHNRAELDKQTRLLQTQAECRVLLVSHGYITDDALMGKRVIQILRDLGVEIVYADVVEPDSAQELSLHLSTDCYWTYSKQLLGGIETYRQVVDGIIFLMAFPCGPDALVVTLCQHAIHDKPLCVLNMDELSGDAGLKTRLESFVDILRLKKERQP